MPSSVRIQRISDRLREELSQLLVKEISDPRLHGVSVTDVRVDRELAFAEVYVSAVEGQARSAEILQGLESAGGYMRRELAARVELRAFPRLRFHWDPTPENADHIEMLLAQIRSEREAAGAAARPAGRKPAKAKKAAPAKARKSRAKKK